MVYLGLSPGGREFESHPRQPTVKSHHVRRYADAVSNISPGADDRVSAGGGSETRQDAIIASDVTDAEATLVTAPTDAMTRTLSRRPRERRAARSTPG